MLFLCSYIYQMNISSILSKDLLPLPYTHWMLKEIYEQPDVLRATLDQYIDGSGFRDEMCAPLRHWLSQTKREIVIAASGSSRHAGMAGEIMIEDLTGIAVDGSDLFVVNSNLGTIGEYTISGATVNASLITGISSPQGIVIEASSTPEPNSIALLGLGLASLEFLRRKRIKA